MRLADVLTGDIVLVNRKGRIFHATVTALEPRGLAIEPIDKRVTYRRCGSHDVVGHWSRRGRPRTSQDPLSPSPRQLTLGLDP